MAESFSLYYHRSLLVTYNTMVSCKPKPKPDLSYHLLIPLTWAFCANGHYELWLFEGVVSLVSERWYAVDIFLILWQVCGCYSCSCVDKMGVSISLYLSTLLSAIIIDKWHGSKYSLGSFTRQQSLSISIYRMSCLYFFHSSKFFKYFRLSKMLSIQKVSG